MLKTRTLFVLEVKLGSALVQKYNAIAKPPKQQVAMNVVANKNFGQFCLQLQFQGFTIKLKQNWNDKIVCARCA